MEALTSPRSFLSLEHEFSNSRRRKTRVALLHSRNARRLQHHSLRPGRSLSVPCCRDPPPFPRQEGWFVSLFVLLETAPQVARRGSSRAAFYSPKWFARPAWTVEVRPILSDIDIFAFNVLINIHEVYPGENRWERMRNKTL